LIGLILFTLGCSKDEYCEVKNDLLGTWVNVDDDTDFVIFKEDNTYTKQNINGIKYVFTALDTLGELGSGDRLVKEYFFEFRTEEELFIQGFTNGNDVVYKRPN